MRYSILFMQTDQKVTHTHRQRTTPPTLTHTHPHDKNNTPNPQTNTSHKHLTTLEGGATTVRAASHAWVGGRAEVSVGGTIHVNRGSSLKVVGEWKVRFSFWHRLQTSKTIHTCSKYQSVGFNRKGVAVKEVAKWPGAPAPGAHPLGD